MTSFDISDTLAPKSDQLDAIDLLSGPRVLTVTDVTQGNAEQPVQIHFAEFPRPWRPGVTMRRLIFKLWGGKGSEYVGRKFELYNDESVTFGNDRTGGIRIRSMSHIGPKSRTETLPTSRGKYGKFTVQPLADAAPETPALTAAMIACCTDQAQLRTWWTEHPDQRAAIEARVAEVKSDATQDGATDA